MGAAKAKRKAPKYSEQDKALALGLHHASLICELYRGLLMDAAAQDPLVQARRHERHVGWSAGEGRATCSCSDRPSPDAALAAMTTWAASHLLGFLTAKPPGHGQSWEPSASSAERCRRHARCVPRAAQRLPARQI